MKKLFLIALLAGTYSFASAQSTRKTVANATELVTSAKSLRIETADEKVFIAMRKVMGVKRWSAEIKKDRLGEFITYKVTFKQEQLPLLNRFFAEINGR